LEAGEGSEVSLGEVSDGMAFALWRSGGCCSEVDVEAYRDRDGGRDMAFPKAVKISAAGQLSSKFT
jgi:hypothetical protein